MSEAEEERRPPSKKCHPEDEPSTSDSGQAAPTPTDSDLKVAFPMNGGSLHDSGINKEYLPVWEQLPH